VDLLGKRIKEDYEFRTKSSIPRRTYTIIRVDGKAFHSLTKGFNRPFDFDMIHIMNQTAKKMCESIQGAICAYVQSDEISVLLTDFNRPTSCAWFDGNIQKMCSISASIATLEFNRQMYSIAFFDRNLNPRSTGNHQESTKFYDKNGIVKSAMFDSRVFSIPNAIEVENYFIWRQQDATRNSIQLVAQSLYSHKELHKKGASELQEMIYQKGINWNDYPIGCKRGRLIKKVDKLISGVYEPTWRGKWDICNPPIFSKDRKYLRNIIPELPNFKDNNEE
jgi:tRNA(His) guanylyltransferase